MADGWTTVAAKKGAKPSREKDWADLSSDDDPLVNAFGSRHKAASPPITTSQRFQFESSAEGADATSPTADGFEADHSGTSISSDVDTEIGHDDLPRAVDNAPSSVPASRNSPTLVNNTPLVAIVEIPSEGANGGESVGAMLLLKAHGDFVRFDYDIPEGGISTDTSSHIETTSSPHPGILATATAELSGSPSLPAALLDTPPSEPVDPALLPVKEHQSKGNASTNGPPPLSTTKSDDTHKPVLSSCPFPLSPSSDLSAPAAVEPPLTHGRLPGNIFSRRPADMSPLEWRRLVVEYDRNAANDFYRHLESITNQYIQSCQYNPQQVYEIGWAAVQYFGANNKLCNEREILSALEATASHDDADPPAGIAVTADSPVVGDSTALGCEATMPVATSATHDPRATLPPGDPIMPSTIGIVNDPGIADDIGREGDDTWAAPTGTAVDTSVTSNDVVAAGGPALPSVERGSGAARGLGNTPTAPSTTTKSKKKKKKTKQTTASTTPPSNVPASTVGFSDVTEEMVTAFLETTGPDTVRPATDEADAKGVGEMSNGRLIDTCRSLAVVSRSTDIGGCIDTDARAKSHGL